MSKLLLCAFLVFAAGLGLAHTGESSPGDRVQSLQEAIYAKGGRAADEQLAKLIKDAVIDRNLGELFALKKEFIETSASRSEILSKRLQKTKYFGLNIEEAMKLPVYAQHELCWWWSLAGDGERAMLLANVMASSGDATQKSLAAMGMSLAYGSVAKWDDGVSWAKQAGTFASFSSGQSSGGKAPRWLELAVRRRIDEATLLRFRAVSCG